MLDYTVRDISADQFEITLDWLEGEVVRVVFDGARADGHIHQCSMVTELGRNITVAYSEGKGVWLTDNDFVCEADLTPEEWATAMEFTRESIAKLQARKARE